ncbi:mitochondrial carnitine/acylcarnitine carrier protein isoform X2 [Eurytemora carolleeae]|uniref:mitochondrial carnitine/acylcarnitine carrier protein isoform X2 n=1 Tax=Eurytemora carolleeae TaxID=1294199 RepID=UPI000C774960|nr:mitochondrial carnitine/acylcarnitine carrier protein isoform X2 [Eurytemora carolleeae]|eukprot:XP_023345730.1 mitochondrial carnitine/acylcarnitine carrier protein-like isoform X2 [Eurytemora affinis]
MSEKQRVSEVKNFISGGVGGVAAIVSGHPFDTIKVRLQTQSTRYTRNPLYSGTVDCVKKTVQHEGVRALYKGMAAPVVGATPIFALGFMGFGLGKKLQQSHPDEALGPLKLAVAGGFSGMVATVVMAPGERIKCVLQVQQGAQAADSVKYKGPVHVIKALIAEGGLSSLYKGTVATLARDIPASAAFYASYELIQRRLAPDGDRSQIGVGRTLLAGGTAGVCNWLVAIPADVVKSRLQSAPTGTYSGTMDVLRKLLAEDGARGLYKGAVPVLLRAFPANAFCFLGFECAMYSLNSIAPNL